jgi:hypothetical protein
MSLITIVITLIVVGVLLWLINTYIPMDGKIKQIINIVVVVAVVVWLLNVFGVLGNLRAVHVSIQPPALDQSAYRLSTQPAAQICTSPLGLPALAGQVCPLLIMPLKPLIAIADWVAAA